jgi:Condensin complex subunit 2
MTRKSFGTSYSSKERENFVTKQNGSGSFSSMYSTVIKMNTENKINIKNSWSLPLIDHMEKFIFDSSSASLNQRSSTESTVNFQRISCALDASIKIYSYRVDDVWSSSYRVLESLSLGDKKETENENTKSDDVDTFEEDVFRTKKHHKHVASSTIETKLENITSKQVESSFDVDPLFQKLSSEFDSAGLQSLLLIRLPLSELGCNIAFDSLSSKDSNSMLGSGFNDTVDPFLNPSPFMASIGLQSSIVEPGSNANSFLTQISESKLAPSIYTLYESVERMEVSSRPLHTTMNNTFTTTMLQTTMTAHDLSIALPQLSYQDPDPPIESNHSLETVESLDADIPLAFVDDPTTTQWNVFQRLSDAISRSSIGGEVATIRSPGRPVFPLVNEDDYADGYAYVEATVNGTDEMNLVDDEASNGLGSTNAITALQTDQGFIDHQSSQKVDENRPDTSYLTNANIVLQSLEVGSQVAHWKYATKKKEKKSNSALKTSDAVELLEDDIKEVKGTTKTQGRNTQSKLKISQIDFFSPSADLQSKFSSSKRLPSIRSSAVTNSLMLPSLLPYDIEQFHPSTSFFQQVCSLELLPTVSIDASSVLFMTSTWNGTETKKGDDFTASPIRGSDDFHAEDVYITNNNSWGSPSNNDNQINKTFSSTIHDIPSSLDLISATRRVANIKVAYDTVAKKVDVGALQNTMHSLLFKSNPPIVSHKEVETSYFDLSSTSFDDISMLQTPNPPSINPISSMSNISFHDIVSEMGMTASSTVTVPFYLITALHLANKYDLSFLSKSLDDFTVVKLKEKK